MSAKFELEKFDGKEDFNLWRKKLKAISVQLKVSKILDKPEDLLEPLSEAKKREMDEIAFSTTILYLFDSVLRQVDEITTTVELWKKLEIMYLKKSLTNKILLKERLFGYRMDPSKSLDDNLDEFVKIFLDVTNIGEKIDDENQTIILLNSLPESYKEIKATIKYGRDSLTLRLVPDALRSKDMETRTQKKDTKALTVRGRPETRTNQPKNTKRDQTKNRSKSKGKETRECFYCHKPGHLIKDCRKLQYKNKNQNKKEGQN